MGDKRYLTQTEFAAKKALPSITELKKEIESLKAERDGLIQNANHAQRVMREANTNYVRLQQQVEALQAERDALKLENELLRDNMMEIRGMVRPIIQNAPQILEAATPPNGEQTDE